MTKSAKDYIKDEWNFDLVDKKHIRFTSNVVKEKFGNVVDAFYAMHGVLKTM